MIKLLAEWFEHYLTHDAFMHMTDEELAEALLSFLKDRGVTLASSES